MIIATTLAAIAILAGTIAVLSLDKIRDWLRRRAANRYGDLIKREIQDGKVEIIAIGISASGSETGQKTWTAQSLDPELAATFGYRQRVRITV